MRSCYGCGQGFKAKSAGRKRRKLCTTCWTEQPLEAVPVEVGASYGRERVMPASDMPVICGPDPYA